jgi:predicted metal-binding membrane protein
MKGMDMGVTTKLGSFRSFFGLWVLMMAAMMLPGATPALVRRVHVRGRWRDVPFFLSSYVAVWALVGVVVYGLYRPHRATLAGAVAMAAGIYELTPLKQHFRQRCRENARSGLSFGVCCAGSSIGLMMLLLAVGVMSITWMAVIAVVVVAQKIAPFKAAIDVPLALAIIGLGILIVLAPSAVPDLASGM